MFREMRRIRQQLPMDKTEAIFRTATSGVLALHGDDGYPYAVPLSYVYEDGHFYFHGATEGHKIDAIRRCEKASFCVVAADDVVGQELTTHYVSAMAFGRVRIVEDAQEKRAAVTALARRYAPAHVEKGLREMEESWNRLCIFVLEAEHMTGKQCRELMGK